MESLAALYKNHIVTLQERTRDVLARFKLDALLIHSGELFNVFLDDHPYPFKVNPQFKAWVPVTQVPNCWLLVDGVNKPKLWFYLPVDYWHNVEPLPTSFWTEEVEVVACRKRMALAVNYLPRGAILAISVRYRSVRYSWISWPVTSTRKGDRLSTLLSRV